MEKVMVQDFSGFPNDFLLSSTVMCNNWGDGRTVAQIIFRTCGSLRLWVLWRNLFRKYHKFSWNSFCCSTVRLPNLHCASAANLCSELEIYALQPRSRRFHLAELVKQHLMVPLVLSKESHCLTLGYLISPYHLFPVQRVPLKIVRLYCAAREEFFSK